MNINTIDNNREMSINTKKCDNFTRFKMTYITDDEVAIIVRNYFPKENARLQKYFIDFASKNMLGFLCDYLKLNIYVNINNNRNEKRVINCFVKSISKSNEAKAAMVKELQLFDKELRFYTIIKEKIHISGMKPWSPKFIVGLKEAMVFENLNSLGYKMHDKLISFDKAHTLQALRTLARFHASTIIYEETKSKDLNRIYSINEEYEDYLDKGGYLITDPWFVQCMHGALEVIKSHSKYSKNKDIIHICEEKWSDIWRAALNLSDFSSKYRNVICHRDLWNNNMVFHYAGVGKDAPDDCLLVDFQAVRCHPPAGDIMLLFYCNLEPTFREENLNMFLNYYYSELDTLLQQHDIAIDSVITSEELYKTAEEYRLWGLIVSACLLPQCWINDELTTKIFTDSAQFNEILSKDKASFIRKMIDENDSYASKVLGIFEEIVSQYVLL